MLESVRLTGLGFVRDVGFGLPSPPAERRDLDHDVLLGPAAQRRLLSDVVYNLGPGV